MAHFIRETAITDCSFLDNENRVVLRPLQLQVGSGIEMEAIYRKTMDTELTEMATVEPDYINASFIEVFTNCSILSDTCNNDFYQSYVVCS